MKPAAPLKLVAGTTALTAETVLECAGDGLVFEKTVLGLPHPVFAGLVVVDFEPAASCPEDPPGSVRYLLTFQEPLPGT